MNYRLANKKDLSKIVDFLKFVDCDFIPPLSKRFDIARQMQSLFEHDDKFLLLEKKDRIIGIIIFSESQGNNKNICAHISYLAIHPSYRNKFYGRNLLTECLNFLTNKKNRKVSIDTWSTNKKALDLYYKKGFEIKKVFKNDRGEKLDTVVLEEPLDGIRIVKKDKNEKTKKH